MSERVCAVVVTYNRKELLRECLKALSSQARPVDQILVIDNAGTDGTPDMVAGEFPAVALLKLSKNLGGAGGFHAGMKQAYEQGFDWLWVMDDDGRPDAECLARLMAHQKPGAVLVPLQQDSRSGKLYGAFRWHSGGVDVSAGPYKDATEEVLARNEPVESNFLFTFVGPIISRQIVDQIGLPHQNFFIYFDDIEYALRIQKETNASIIAVPDARFIHDFAGTETPRSFLGRISIRKSHPPWKMYYETRNYLYTVTRTRRSRPETLQCFIFQFRRMLGDVLYEPDRWIRVRLRFKGLFDGATGRLGKRVSPK